MVTIAEPPIEPETREDVAARLRLMSARLSRRLRQEAAAGLSPGLMSALATIHAHGPLTPSDLAARERLARPGVTRMIVRLEREGLVTSVPDPVDRRSYTIEVSRAGTALLRRSRRRSKAFLSRALRPLSDREVATLAEAATILTRLLEAEH
jgi:DNA-binding MarR family transcriptional regulator